MKTILLAILIGLTVINSICCGKLNSRAGIKKSLIGYYRLKESWLLQMRGIAWGHYTDVVYYGLVPLGDYALSVSSADQRYIPLIEPGSENFTAMAKEARLTPILGVGDKDAVYWSAYMDDQYRQNLAAQVVKVAKDNKYEGLAIDWQSPGVDKVGCAQVNPTTDLQNLGKFIKEIRTQWKDIKKIILRVSAPGLLGPSGNVATKEEMSDLVANVDLFDYMAYDAYTPNSNVNDPLNGEANRLVLSGPSSILYSQCDRVKPDNSIEAVVKKLQLQGVSPGQIVISVADYARLFTLTNGFDGRKGLLQKHLGYATAKGMSEIDVGRQNVCGVSRASEGKYLYKELIMNGFLSEDGTQGGESADKFQRNFQDCNQVPYLLSSNEKFLLVYEDAQSLKAKAQWIINNGLAGMAIFGMNGFTDEVVSVAATSLGGNVSMK